MPRQAHGRPLQASNAPRAAKKRTRKNRGLNALEIAEQENPEQIKIAPHRLGVVDDDDDDNEPNGREDDDDERSTKRRKVAGGATQEDDDDDEGGSDLDGNRWHVGVGDDDEDSDIDSEDAFGASDEERFADFTFGGTSTSTDSKKKPQRNRKPRPVDLDEEDDGLDSADEEDGDEDEEDDDFGVEGVDLATAWDMDDKDEEEFEAAKQKKKSSKRSQRPESDGEDEEQSDAGLSEDNESSEDEDEDAESQFSLSDDEGDHSKLQNFVQGLTHDASAASSKNRKGTYKALSDKPSQFGLGSSKISAADLLQYIKDPRQRQSLKVLQNNEGKGDEVYKGGIPGKLAPPLAKRQQDRLDRNAAYDESKKELSKWIETVKRNRRAEHISFPIQDPAAEAALNSTQLGPTLQEQPMTSLESTIQEIMVESGLLSKEQGSLDDQEQAFEELHEKKMPLEEVQARRAELRRARDLMFREEIRARRVKKIKSKAYRRVHRKERDKVMAETRNLLSAQGLIDSDEEREKNDRRRAEERMGARHRESKWAKSVKTTGRAAWDDDARHGVTDLARRDEELRRRIQGKANVDSDEDASESSESDEWSGSDEEREMLENKINDLVEQDEPDSTASRLGSMAFMKKAEAARKAANDEAIQSLRRSLRETDDGSTAETDSGDDEPVGRRKFGSSGNQKEAKPVTHVEKSEFEERESDGEPDDNDEAVEKTEQGRLTVGRAPPAAPGRKEVKARVVETSQPASDSVRLSAKTSKPSSATSKPTAQGQWSKAGRSLKKETKIPESELADYTSPSESEDEPDTQAALAQAIFAGPDGLEQDFAKEKKEVEEEEGDQIIDNGLPGWGNWAGEGISKKAQKRAKGRFLTTIKGVDRDKRQDAKLDRVIVNEKRVKKNSKYLATELPHPFESRQQYERSLRLPLGPEWTTKSTFQDATKPRVLVKQGIIRPMARPMV
jgi:U3 small nucleolar RNA-associated protein 14